MIGETFGTFDGFVIRTVFLQATRVGHWQAPQGA